MGDRHLYGDYIVWRQIIDKAVAEKKDFIFVSDDLKEDWLLEIHGKKKGPRRELIKEFYDKTDGNTILIYNQEQFLNYARTNEKADIQEETIKEVKTVYRDLQKLYAECLQPSVLSTYGVESLSASVQPLLSKPLFENNGLLSALDSCKALGDSLRSQAENMQSVLEPYSRITQSMYTPDHLTSINDALSPNSIISSQLLGITPKEPHNLTGLLYPSIGKEDKK